MTEEISGSPDSGEFQFFLYQFNKQCAIKRRKQVNLRKTTGKNVCGSY